MMKSNKFLATLTLAFGLSSCGESLVTSPSSLQVNTLRVQINRQTADIDPRVDSVRVVLFADAGLENSIGDTGSLLISSDVVSGEINNVASGIYVLQCQTLDQAGQVLTRGNVVPVDVSSSSAQVSVRCNVQPGSEPTIEVFGFPEVISANTNFEYSFIAEAVPGRLIEDVSLQFFGDFVGTPGPFPECRNVPRCEVTSSIFTGSFEQVVSNVFTVTDVEGQSSSVTEVTQVSFDIQPPIAATPAPTQLSIVGRWRYQADSDFFYETGVGFSIVPFPFAADADIFTVDDGDGVEELKISDFYLSSSGLGEASFEDNTLQATLPLLFGAGELVATLSTDGNTLVGTIRFSSRVPGEAEAELPFVMTRIVPVVQVPVVRTFNVDLSH